MTCWHKQESRESFNTVPLVFAKITQIIMEKLLKQEDKIMSIKGILVYSGVVAVMFLPLWIGAYFYGKLTGNVAEAITNRLVK